MDDDEFADILASARAVPGWLTDDQARVLFDEARRLPAQPTVIEIGSHQGRSTTVLAAGLSSGRVVAVDPFVTTRRYAGPSVERQLRDHLAARQLVERVDIRPDRSRSVLSGWDEPIDLLFVDGKHDMASCLADLRWRRHLRPRGRVLVHDAFSSIGVTLAIVLGVLPSRDLAFLGRVGSLARFELRRPTWRDRFRILGELGWWTRNVCIKVLLRLRLRALTRALGHTQGRYDPY